MILNEDQIRRMIDLSGLSMGSSGGSSGGGGSIPAGAFVTPQYYSQNFGLLYKQVTTDGTTGTVTTAFELAAPNMIPTVGTETDPATGNVVVTSLIGPQVMNALVIGNIMLTYDETNNAIKVVNRDGTTAANFYATGGVSALGYSPGGGGGGGADLNLLLDNINSSNIGNIAPTSSEVGKCLVYNGNNQWAWATPGGGGGTGTVTSITAGTGLSGGTITTSGTIAISSAYQGYISHGETAYGWGNHADAGYLTSADLPALGISNGVITIGNNTITPVTQVAMTVPTGFTISGSPVTKSGTLELGIASGYFMPTTAQRTTWNNKQDAISDLSTIRSNASHGETAYGWGNHADAGYAKASDLSDYLPLSGGTLTGALHMGSTAGASPFIYWGDGTYAYIGEDADDHITLRGDKGVNILTGSNYELEWNGDALATQAWVDDQGFVKSSGVTSVGLSVPTGFTVSGSPVTTSGTLALGIASGYFMPTTTQRTTWNGKQDAISDLATIRSNASHGETAYGWGNHADKGYLLRTEGMRFTSYGNYIAARFVNADGTYDATRAAKAQGDGYIEWWSDGGYFNHEMGFIRAKGNITIGTGTSDTTHYLQIGGARLYWDNANNALKLIKADGTACNLYATGGVTALQTS